MNLKVFRRKRIKSEGAIISFISPDKNICSLSFYSLFYNGVKIVTVKSVRLKDEIKKTASTKAENHAPVPLGTLVVIGGKENKGENGPENKKKPADFIKLEVLQAFKDATHKKEPVVEVITTATSEGKEAFNEYVKVFEKIGITNVGHIHHKTRKEVLNDDLMERIKNPDAFFFSGGDQLVLTGMYGGTPFLTELKQRYINYPIYWWNECRRHGFIHPHDLCRKPGSTGNRRPD